MLELYKYSGLLAISILFIGLMFLVIKWPQGSAKTFSQHAAAQQFTIYYYIGLFSIVLPLLLVFFVGYFVPTFHLPVAFTISIIASSVAQYACTLIPEVGGWKTKVHLALAGISAVLLLPCVYALRFIDSISDTERSLVIGAHLLMFAMLLVIVLYKGNVRRALIFQAVYFTLFFGAILLVTLF